MKRLALALAALYLAPYAVRTLAYKFTAQQTGHNPCEPHSQPSAS